MTSRIISPLALLSSLVLFAGCKAPATPESAPAAPTAATPAAETALDSIVPDTHILDLADGTAVWLIPGRVGRAENGGSCLERGIQLRKGPLKMTVPLLYTSSLPDVIDGKLVATISNSCVTGDRYTIDPATAQPTKLESRAR